MEKIPHGMEDAPKGDVAPESLMKKMTRNAKGLFIPITGKVEIDLQALSMEDGDLLIMKSATQPTQEMMQGLSQALAHTQKRIQLIVVPDTFQFEGMSAEHLKAMGLVRISEEKPEPDAGAVSQFKEIIKP